MNEHPIQLRGCDSPHSQPQARNPGACTPIAGGHWTRSRLGVLALMAVFAAMLAFNPARADQPAVAGEPTLYERLGGYDAIAAVVDKLIDGVEEKFAGLSEHSRMRSRQLIVDFICSETGGPCFYAGRDMRTTHEGLRITQAEWEEFVGVFSETMAAFEVPEREQEELAGLLLPLEEQIVDRG